jgi:hypothetical protein
MGKETTMHARFRLFRSCGFSALEAAAHAVRLSRMLAFAGLLSVATCAACSAPTAPTTPEPKADTEWHEPVVQVRIPKHHNIPFSMKGDEGHVHWLCATQPRQYVGFIEEEDHYAQDTPCPVIPVE